MRQASIREKCNENEARKQFSKYFALKDALKQFDES